MKKKKILPGIDEYLMIVVKSALITIMLLCTGDGSKPRGREQIPPKQNIENYRDSLMNVKER